MPAPRRLEHTISKCVVKEAGWKTLPQKRVIRRPIRSSVKTQTRLEETQISEPCRIAQESGDARGQHVRDGVDTGNPARFGLAEASEPEDDRLVNRDSCNASPLLKNLNPAASRVSPATRL